MVKHEEKSELCDSLQACLERDMSGVISALKTLLAQHHQQVRRRHFLEAAMGASALLALADGEISLAELMARDYVLDHVKELQVFDPNEAAELFRSYAEAIEADPDAGSSKVLKAVTQLSGDRGLAPLLLRVCVVIGKADFNFSEREREVVATLCDVLGLERMEFDSQPEEGEQGENFPIKNDN